MAGDGAAAQPARALAGLRIGRYAVSELIGRGASGDVYLARDVELERQVAMKFLRCGATPSHWRVDWFLREAKAASALNHPGIITVYEVIQSESGLAIAMELVEGKALCEFRGTAAPISQVTEWGRQVSSALAAAHEAGGCGVLVSLGGDIATAGPAPAGGWRIHVTDDHRSDATAPG